MDWSASICSDFTFEHICTGFFCPMILFGSTNARLAALSGDPYPECASFACAYTGAFALGAIIPYFIPLAADIYTLNALSNICGAVGVGAYAGSRRSLLRNKYGIEGSKCTDFLLHCMISPCALCQEARQIQHASVSQQYTPVTPHEPFSK